MTYHEQDCGQGRAAPPPSAHSFLPTEALRRAVWRGHGASPCSKTENRGSREGEHIGVPASALEARPQEALGWRAKDL